MTIKELQSNTNKELLSTFSSNEAKYIVDLMMSNFLKIAKIQLVLTANNTVEKKLVDFMENATLRLKNNEPFQYILEEEQFYGHTFKVNNNVLIPRPETEELVEWVIQSIDNKLAGLKILDIGTGSGCIPISLKLSLNNAVIHACDISDEALMIAKENSVNLNAPIEFFQLDILAKENWGSQEFYDIIVSNPPYIPNKEKQLMHENVLNFEPGLALFVEDEEALIFYDKIMQFALLKLKKNGFLFFECNEYNAEKVVDLIRKNGFSNIELRKDINGKNRMIKAQLL